MNKFLHNRHKTYIPGKSSNWNVLQSPGSRRINMKRYLNWLRNAWKGEWCGRIRSLPESLSCVCIHHKASESSFWKNMNSFTHLQLQQRLKYPSTLKKTFFLNSALVIWEKLNRNKSSSAGKPKSPKSPANFCPNLDLLPGVPVTDVHSLLSEARGAWEEQRPLCETRPGLKMVSESEVLGGTGLQRGRLLHPAACYTPFKIKAHSVTVPLP